MTFSVRRAPLRLRLGLLALASILLLSALFAFLPPDGLERASWIQFIGRFHLLTVHFPIALILIVPVLEWAGRKPRFAYLRSSVDFVLALAHAEQFGRCNSGMVPGAEWRVFGTAGHAAHVGWSIRCGGLLAMLDAAWILPWSACSISSTPWRCWPPLGLCPGRDIAAVNYRKAKITSPSICRECCES